MFNLFKGKRFSRYSLTLSLIALIRLVQMVLEVVIDLVADFGAIVVVVCTLDFRFSLVSSPGQPLLPF